VHELLFAGGGGGRPEPGPGSRGGVRYCGRVGALPAILSSRRGAAAAAGAGKRRS